MAFTGGGVMSARRWGQVGGMSVAEEAGGEDVGADGDAEVPAYTACGVVAIGTHTSERELETKLQFAEKFRVAQPSAVVCSRAIGVGLYLTQGQEAVKRADRKSVV